MNGVSNRHRLQNAQARRKKTQPQTSSKCEVQREKRLLVFTFNSRFAVVWLSGSDLLMRVPLRHQAPAVQTTSTHHTRPYSHGGQL